MDKEFPKLIIFDWEGTLSDSSYYFLLALNKAAQKWELPPPTAECLAKVHGLSLEAALTIIYPTLEIPLVLQLVSDVKRNYLLLDKKPVLVEGARQVLSFFKDHGVSLAIATAKGRHDLEQDLIATDSAQFFSAIRSAQDSFSKPNPAMVLDLLDVLGMQEKDAVVVGDSKYDILMAKNANVKSVAAVYGNDTEDSLMQAQPDFTIHSIHELQSLFPQRGQ